MLIMRALTEDPMIQHCLILPQLGDREWSVAWNHYHATHISQCCNTIDTAIARTTTTLSVACIISLVMHDGTNGRHGTKAVCPLLRECRTGLRGRLWPMIQHSDLMWRWLASVEEDETPVLHRLEGGTGYICWHHNEGSSSSQQECWCCWRHGGDYQIHGSFVFVPLGCPPYRCPRQQLFEPRFAT